MSRAGIVRGERDMALVHTLEHTQSETCNLKGSADILPCPSPGKGPCIWVTLGAKGKNRAEEEAPHRKMSSSQH